MNPGSLTSASLFLTTYGPSVGPSNLGVSTSQTGVTTPKYPESQRERVCRSGYVRPQAPCGNHKRLSNVLGSWTPV